MGCFFCQYLLLGGFKGKPKGLPPFQGLPFFETNPFGLELRHDRRVQGFCLSSGESEPSLRNIKAFGSVFFELLLFVFKGNSTKRTAKRRTRCISFPTVGLAVDGHRRPVSSIAGGNMMLEPFTAPPFTHPAHPTRQVFILFAEKRCGMELDRRIGFGYVDPSLEWTGNQPFVYSMLKMVVHVGFP